MRIENDVKLDFKDVLIRPKRSTLTTRSDVDISREYRFRHTGTEIGMGLYNVLARIAAKAMHLERWQKFSAIGDDLDASRWGRFWT